MKIAFPVITVALPGILLLCLSSEAAAAQTPASAEKNASALKTSNRGDQSGVSESVTQANHPSGSSAAADQPKPGKNDSAAQQYYESATGLYAAGRFDDAISAFLQSAKLKPDNAQTHYGLGMAYAKSKSYQEASESFKRAVKFKPDWPEANFRVGMMAYVLGDKTEANEIYNKLRRLNSPLANTLYRVIREEGSPSAAEVDPKPVDLLPVSTANTDAENTRKETPTEQKSPSTPANESAKGVAVAALRDTTPSSEQPPTAIYRVGAGDVLDVRLLNSTTPRSTLFTVMDGGLIDFPVAGGPILVAGFTTEEIQSRIATELKRRAVEVNSQVTVGVRQYSSHAVIVTGLVSTPGTRYLRREAIPLYVLMAEVQPRLDAGRITILRAGVEAKTFDLSDSNALATLVQQGDVINVGPRPQEFYYIGGRVNYAGQKAFQSGITLLQAILAAGGPSQNETTIELSRESADGRLTTSRFSLKDIKSGKVQDPKLRPGDRIEVVR